jgi:hypothetical protein
MSELSLNSEWVNRNSAVDPACGVALPRLLASNGWLARGDGGAVERVQLRRRFWLEVVCGSAGLLLFIVTLLSREWIEAVFRVDPDGGSGALEYLIAIGLLNVTVLSGFLARREWARPATA